MITGSPYANVTILTVSWNQKEVLELMLKSYVRHHYVGYPLNIILWDNASTDGTVEWLIENNIPFMRSATNIGHEQAINVCYPAVATPYCLLVDTDIIFNEKIWLFSDHLDDDIVAAGDFIDGDNLGSPIKPRLGAWFILFNIAKCREKGITYFRNKEDWSYDCASQFYENIKLAGLDIYDIKRLPGDIDRDIIGMRYGAFDHLLRMSWDLNKHGDREGEIRMRQEFVKNKLKEYADIDIKNKFTCQV